MLFKKKSLSKTQKSAITKANDVEKEQTDTAVPKSDCSVRKVSDREIALSYILW